jgi:hypothetical protein
MRVFAVSWLMFAGLLLGCSASGPPRAAVSGTVKLNGQPVEEGSIQFIPVEGTTGPGVGGIIKNGQYQIPQAKGVMVGKNRVELRAIKKTGKKVQDPTKPQGILTDERGQAFPPEYNDDSTLVRDIKAEDNIVNFDIEAKGSGK